MLRSLWNIMLIQHDIFSCPRNINKHHMKYKELITLEEYSRARYVYKDKRGHICHNIRDDMTIEVNSTWY